VHPAEPWAEELERLRHGGAELEWFVRALRDELDRVRRCVVAAVVGDARRPEHNGYGAAWGVALMRHGVPVRAAAVLSGVPRATLHDLARR
jgi:hypothetical protein